MMRMNQVLVRVLLAPMPRECLKITGLVARSNRSISAGHELPVSPVLNHKLLAGMKCRVAESKLSDCNSALSELIINAMMMLEADECIS